MMVGILQGLVANEGTGWDHALAQLKAFYEGMTPEQVAAIEQSRCPGRSATRSSGTRATRSGPGRAVPRRRRAARPADGRDAPGAGERPDRPGVPARAALLVRPDAPRRRRSTTRPTRVQAALEGRVASLPEATQGDAHQFLDQAGRAAQAGRRARRPEDRRGEDPLPRRLPPRAGPPDGRRLRPPRLRRGARQVAPRAAGEAVGAEGRRRDDPVVRLRRVRRPVRPQPGSARAVQPRSRGARSSGGRGCRRPSCASTWRSAATPCSSRKTRRAWPSSSKSSSSTRPCTNCSTS